MTTTRRTRCTYRGGLLAVLLVAAGCGSTPAPVEVTEPWTSGDERALGIDEPGTLAASASETTTDEGAASQ